MDHWCHLPVTYWNTWGVGGPSAVGLYTQHAGPSTWHLHWDNVHLHLVPLPYTWMNRNWRIASTWCSHHEALSATKKNTTAEVFKDSSCKCHTIKEHHSRSVQRFKQYHTMSTRPPQDSVVKLGKRLAWGTLDWPIKPGTWSPLPWKDLVFSLGLIHVSPPWRSYLPSLGSPE